MQGMDYCLRKPQSPKLSPVVLTQHSKNEMAKHPPLSACLTSFKRRLKLKQPSKHRHSFLAKSKGALTTVRSVKNKGRLKCLSKSTQLKGTVSIFQKQQSCRRIDALLDHPRKEEQGHARGEKRFLRRTLQNGRLLRFTLSAHMLF